MNHAVRLTARIPAGGRAIKLLWLRDADATGYTVARKKPAGTKWNLLATLPRTATQYLDNGVSTGMEYEYKVVKSAPGYKGYGFISAGISVPLADDRGTILLVVENSLASPLASELARLQKDLTGDGWLVQRLDVDRQATVPSVKAQIETAYQADPQHVRALFLFGHVPVPYSGNFAPDEHSEHVGAWPADAYYGIFEGDWTDTTVNNPNGADVRSRNLPGDGKFDQSTLPATVALQIGRVDLANLPLFSQSETELLRRYLDKNHAYRHAQTNVTPDGLIADQFGIWGGEAFASMAWDSFSSLLGPTHVAAQDYFPRLISESRLFAYAGGGGSYTNVGSIAYAAQFSSQTSLAVVNAFFGSYFGDWDSPDNLLRSTLANNGYGIATFWAAHPFWYLHPLGQGHTLGYCAQLTQNNTTLYPPGRFARGVHIALLGDPTLRLYPVAPASNLQSVQIGANRKLTWSAPASAPAGYRVYRATTPAGPYTRLNQTLAQGTEFVDANAPGTATYQVRALRQQSSNSGTYTNASQGVFLTVP